jgi:hypothetical protein
MHRRSGNTKTYIDALKTERKIGGGGVERERESVSVN